METKEEFYEFENRMSKEMNTLYVKWDWQLSLFKGDKRWDKVVQIDGKTVTIEEKHRSQIRDDILIEIIQDTETKSPGWYEYCEADVIIYTMAKNEKSLKPTHVYWIDWPAFKEYFDKETLKYFNNIVSKKGWGTTINKVIPLPYIPRRICRLTDY